jgi:hypothetical protein
MYFHQGQAVTLLAEYKLKGNHAFYAIPLA